MSLFKCKEWWSVNLNESELYDHQCMLVTVIGKDRYQSILLGNHEGFFRIFGPTSGMTEDGNIIGYKPSDLIFEMQFPAPILQMGIGTLVSGCHEKNLAVLHPKLLSVYSLSRRDNESSIGDQISLNLVYQHNLRHSAYSFVVGPFGGGRGRDFLCVQALDGLLTFYEQESFCFQVYVPDFLLPSPFVYVDKTDCFLFLNSSLIFDCYTYEALASSESSKKVVRYWSYNIGESVLDVRAVTSDKCNIVVITDRNLYDISDGGQLIFMKRLEYRPMAFFPFVTAETKKLIILVAGDNSLLNIYEETCLKWSMVLDEVPVCLNRIIRSNLYGGIVSLTENGHLRCLYLGTRPSVYLVPPMADAKFDAAEAETELKRLYKEIFERDVAEASDADLISVSLAVESRSVEEGGKRICRVSLEISNQTPIDKIQVAFVVDPPLSVGDKSRTVSCCDRTIVENYAFVSGSGAASNLKIRAFASYKTGAGSPFVIQREGNLPFDLVATKANPTKEAKYKITVVTTKAVCPLNVMFKEFVDESGNQNVIGMRYVGSDSAVTVLTAKTTQRYRFQSDSLESIGLVLATAVDRLKRHEGSEFSLSYDGSLPLQSFFESVESYRRLLDERKTARERLSKRTSQYRTIQKKVLMNLVDVTPKPVANLHGILSETYRMIISSLEEIEGIEERLEISRCSINALCSLVVSLMELMTISVSDMDYLRSIFSGGVYDSDDQGWLEAQSAAAAFLLKTKFAKSIKDQQKPSEISLEPIANSSKLFKSYSSIIDRATKGTHLMERSEYECDKELLATIPGVTEAEEEADADIIPEGSKLADFSGAVPTRKEKRLTKQERVDSLGAMGNAEEHEIPENDDAETEGTEPGGEKLENRGKSSFDSVDEDAVWDVKTDQIRI